MKILSKAEAIVECPNCKQPEYWDNMHIKDGKYYCRKCIYDKMNIKNHPTFPDKD